MNMQKITKAPQAPRSFSVNDRAAFTGIEDKGLRITFDTNIRFRRIALRLDGCSLGTDILEPGKILMEVKTPLAFPLWLSRALSGGRIFPASFSKYGTCFRNFILSDMNSIDMNSVDMNSKNTTRGKKESLYA